ncbi:MAG: TonB-dependent receptor [Ignavibacteria bacterium]|nr:MAG: TonB-dependent receptor [Ignavibacteria bacterium]
MPRRAFYLSMILLAVSSAYAQYGKISGAVINKQTREPLIGATVAVPGTTLGGATGTDGSYVILNVPPGVYAVKAAYIGFQDVTINNVEISAGLTRDLNFEMSEAAVEVQPVIIVAERPLIEKSATNAVRISRADEMEKMPIRGTQAVIALQPGVVLQNDRIHIRGSRPSEVGFQVEGATTTNIVGGRLNPSDEGGGSIISTIPEAVQEVQVQAGGYTAEYGRANSGLVSTNLKTGSDRYTALAQVESDNFADRGKQFLSTYSYGYSDYVLHLSGPALSDKVRFFVAGENRFVHDYDPVFWGGADFGVLKDDGRRGGDTVGTGRVNWLPGNVAGTSNNQYSLNGTLLFDLKELQIKGSALYARQRVRANGLSGDVDVPQIIPLQNIFNQDRLPQVDKGNLLLSGKGTYFFNPVLFTELSVSFLDTRSKLYDPNFDDNLIAYGDSIEGAKRGWHYTSYSDPPRPYDFYGFPFNRPGFPLSGFRKYQYNYWSTNLNVTSQTQKHEIRGGVSYERWTARNYGGIGALEPANVLTAMRNQPDAARSTDQLARLIRKETFLDNYGYDEFGKQIDSGPDGPRHPQFWALYLQDKVEFSDLIINGGLRFDYIDMDTWEIDNPNDPGFDQSEYLISADKIKKGRTFKYIEPRLGFSFPVTDRTVFHLQYGLFVQPPPLFTAYRGRAAAALIYTGQFYVTNPLAIDVEPVRTTQYEIGFTQQFTDFASFDITGFYKDIKGQLQNDVFLVNRLVATVQNYPIYVNSDFATTKGVELRVTLRRMNRIQAIMNYTLSDARGTNSFPASAAAAVAVTNGAVKPTAVTPLGYDQANRGSININYRFGPNDGGPILEQLGFNVLLSFNSGHRFTAATGGGGQQGPETGALLNDGDARSRTPLEPINSSTTPWNFDIDLRVDKSFSFAGSTFNIYGYVQNVLNTQNVVNVYYRTGNAYDDGYLANPGLSQKVVEGLGQNYVDLYNAINVGDRQHQWSLNGVDLFSTPRQLRFGIRYEL